MQGLWGVAVYRSMYPDSEVETVAKREWAHDIIAKSERELKACFAYAKEQMAADPANWKFPNIGRLLAGRPREQIERVAMYKDAQSVLTKQYPDDPGRNHLLSAPERDKAAGRAALAKIRAGL